MSQPISFFVNGVSLAVQYMYTYTSSQVGGHKYIRMIWKLIFNIYTAGQL